MPSELPPKAFESWEKTRAKGPNRYLLWGTIKGTPVIWGLHLLVFQLVFKGRLHTYPWLIAILHYSFWISPLIAFAIASWFWHVLESGYQKTLQAQGKVPPPLPSDASTVPSADPRQVSRPPVIFSQHAATLPTLWTCAPVTRFGAHHAPPRHRPPLGFQPLRISRWIFCYGAHHSPVDLPVAAGRGIRRRLPP